MTVFYADGRQARKNPEADFAANQGTRKTDQKISD